MKAGPAPRDPGPGPAECRRTEKITNGQAMALIIGAILAVIVFTLPGPAIEEASSDAYLSTALASVPALVFAVLFFWLSRRHGWSGPLQYIPEVFGRFLGRMLILVYVLFFILVASTVGQEVPKVVGAVTMPITPQWVFVLMIILVVSYTAYLGVENFSRMAQLVVPLLVAVLIAIPLFTLRYLDFGYLLPVLGGGWRPVLRGMAVPLGVRAEAPVIFAFLLPHIRSPKRGLQACTFTTSALAVLLAVNSISVTAAFSPTIAARLQIPTLSLARLIQLTPGIEHLETLVLGPWIFALAMKVALYVYLAARGLQTAFGLCDWRVAVLPFAVMTGVLGLYLQPDSATINVTMSELRPGASIFVAFLLPLITAAVTVVRGLGRDRSKASGGRTPGRK